jgi:aminoglycoside phosphotransferase (APT) family kinase protein
MLIEMHCHTAEHSSCSSVSAGELVRQVFAKGLQGIVLTDHHYLWSPGELAELRRRAGVPDHFRIMSGQEVQSKEFGDVLIYGATESFPKGTSLREVQQRCPEAALVWAHPYRGSQLPEPDKLCSPLLNGIEIFNSNHTVRGNSRGLQDWHRWRFTAIGGTDTHGASYAGLYPTMFDHPVAMVEELAVEIRQGRCRPFLKEIPRAGARNQVTEVTIGTKGSDENRERIIIRELADQQQWDVADRAYRIMAAIASRDFATGPFRVPRPIDEDADAMTLIEQGVRGKPLFDKLLSSTVDDGREYLKLAARWLARLHGLRLQVTSPAEFLPREEKRLDGYLARFARCHSRHGRKVAEIAAAVREAERQLVVRQEACFVQGHGDYHPKNIIIGQDSQDNRDTLYVAAIDFEGSLVVPPAFDVGCFLAQFRNQFFVQPAILTTYPEECFLDAYLAEAGPVPQDFLRQVELFRARTNLSIASYLLKLGLGESEDVWRVLVEAERALTHL